MAYFLISLDVNITVTVMPPIRTSGQPQSVGQDPHTEGPTTVHKHKTHQQLRQLQKNVEINEKILNLMQKTAR